MINQLLQVVAPILVVFAVILFGQFTVAIFLYSGRFTASAIFKNPVIISVLVSFALLITGISPPQWIAKSTKLIGDITIPVMLITLGVSLSTMRVLNTSRALLLSVARTGMGFLAGLLISWLFDLSGSARGVFILQCSMPVAIFNYLLAEQYGKKPKEVAELIIISTLLSILVLPVILQYLKG